MIEEFNQKMASFNFVLSERQQEELKQYCMLLQEWNGKMNLTAITETDEVYDKHFFDCASALVPEVSGRVLDVGSGAGFPGLVWKILKPELEVVLLEPTQKRCRFLQTVIDSLKLSGIMVVNERAEDYCRQARESYDTVTARAVADLAVLNELCIPFLKVGGIFVAMKGSNAEEELGRAEKGIRILGGSVVRVEELDLSIGKRSNIIIKKEKETDRRYPRRYDQIKKKPL